VPHIFLNHIGYSDFLLNSSFNCFRLVAARYLEVGVLKFGMSEFAIVPPPSQSNRIGSDVFDEERDNDEDKLPSATVLVRGIPKHMTQDILLALLEREQDGGGTVVSTQTEDEHAIVQFEDYRGK